MPFSYLREIWLIVFSASGINVSFALCSIFLHGRFLEQTEQPKYTFLVFYQADTP